MVKVKYQKAVQHYLNKKKQLFSTKLFFPSFQTHFPPHILKSIAHIFCILNLKHHCSSINKSFIKHIINL